MNGKLSGTGVHWTIEFVVSIFRHEKRGCEENGRIEANPFAALFVCSNFVRKKPAERTIPLTPTFGSLRFFSRCPLESGLFVIIFVQIVPNKHKKQFQPHFFQRSSPKSSVFPVFFHHPKGTLCLDGSVHLQISSVDAVQVLQNLFMYRSQFLFQVNRSVLVSPLALFCVGTAAAVFTDIHFHLSAVLVLRYRFSVR